MRWSKRYNNPREKKEKTKSRGGDMAMDFIAILTAAQSGDPVAMEQLQKMYGPMLRHKAQIGGVVDQDLYQELCEEFVVGVYKFDASLPILDRVT